MNNDYLKYWRVIRYFIKAKYGLSQAELDVILFLKSEGYFEGQNVKITGLNGLKLITTPIETETKKD